MQSTNLRRTSAGADLSFFFLKNYTKSGNIFWKIIRAKYYPIVRKKVLQKMELGNVTKNLGKHNIFLLVYAWFTNMVNDSASLHRLINIEEIKSFKLECQPFALLYDRARVFRWFCNLLGGVGVVQCFASNSPSLTSQLKKAVCLTAAPWGPSI